METIKIKFECYGAKGPEINNCFFRYSDNTIQYLEFEKPVKKITHNQFFELMGKINELILEIEAKKELTIKDVEITETPENLKEVAGLALKNKGGFLGMLTTVNNGINNLEKAGKLTEKEKQMTKNAFDLINKLLGVKKI